MRPLGHQHDRRARLIATVLRDVVARETFAAMTDLKDVLWRRLHALRIAATPLEVDDALAMVGSNVALTTVAPSARSQPRQRRT